MKDRSEPGKALVPKTPDAAADSLLRSIEPSLRWIATVIERDPGLSMARIGKFRVTLATCVRVLSDEVRGKNLSDIDEDICMRAVLSASRSMQAEQDDTLDIRTIVERFCTLVRGEMSSNRGDDIKPVE